MAERPLRFEPVETLPRSLLVFGFAFLGWGCALDGSRQRVASGAVDGDLEVAMQLYSPAHLGVGSRSVRQRHRAVERFDSRRINERFEEWGDLDDVLRSLLRRIGGNVPIGTRSGSYRSEYTSPVLGCHDFLRSIAFVAPEDIRIRTVAINGVGSGPQGSSRIRETITLHFITEMGNPVIDGARSTRELHHPYIPELDGTVNLSLEEFLVGRRELWKAWIKECESWSQRKPVATSAKRGSPHDFVREGPVRLDKADQKPSGRFLPCHWRVFTESSLDPAFFHEILSPILPCSCANPLALGACGYDLFELCPAWGGDSVGRQGGEGACG